MIADINMNVQGKLTQRDYSKFLLVHFIVLDTNNARYLWKRIPKKFKDEAFPDNKVLREIWSIGKELAKKNYASALQLSETGSFASQAEVDALIKVFVRVLREVHILRNIQKAYSTIELSSLKQLLGYKSDADVQNLIKDKQWAVKDNYVYPTHVEGGRKKFELNEERIDNLASIVQFLESQKYELK